MPGRRSVDHDEVVVTVGSGEAHQMFDLAQHQQIVDAGGGAGDHAHHAGGHQPLGQSGQALRGEVVLQGFARGDGAQMDAARAVRAETAEDGGSFVGRAIGGSTAQQFGQPGSGVKGHNQHTQTAVG